MTLELPVSAARLSDLLLDRSCPARTSHHLQNPTRTFTNAHPPSSCGAQKSLCPLVQRLHVSSRLERFDTCSAPRRTEANYDENTSELSGHSATCWSTRTTFPVISEQQHKTNIHNSDVRAEENLYSGKCQCSGNRSTEHLTLLHVLISLLMLNL